MDKVGDEEITRAALARYTLEYPGDGAPDPNALALVRTKVVGRLRELGHEVEEPRTETARDAMHGVDPADRNDWRNW
ncbi:MAG: hypothetical protein WEG40_12780 [Candidatus Rokuibacteriota bacterium]